MRIARVTTGGQVSLPAAVRKRWGTQLVSIDDRGDHVVVKPLPDDPIAAARGSLAGKGRPISTTELRAIARRDEAAAERRRRR